jgi:hypothetical protein
MKIEFNGICGATGKRKYSDRKTALAAIDHTTKYLNEDPLTWNAYVCKLCREWHVGHITTNRRVIYLSDAALVDSIVHE